MNGEYIDDSSDDESVDIRALNERLDEEMITGCKKSSMKMMNKKTEDVKIVAVDHTVIKPKRDLSFEAEWIDELKTLNTNHNISSTPEDILDVKHAATSIIFNKIITKVLLNVCKNKQEDYNGIRHYETLFRHRNIEDAELNDIFGNDTDNKLSKMGMTEDDYEEMRDKHFICLLVKIVQILMRMSLMDLLTYNPKNGRLLMILFAVINIMYIIISKIIYTR